VNEYIILIFIPLLANSPVEENSNEKAITAETGGKKKGIKIEFSSSLDNTPLFLAEKQLGKSVIKKEMTVDKKD
jgi:phosphosulfolactate phosphohydrolase-like enzyme